MTLNEGNRVKNILTGKVYQVKKINRDWVLLQAAGGSSQVLTGKMGLKFTYVWEGVQEESLDIVPLFPELGQKGGKTGGVHLS
jgi:hypothetical protein